MSIRALNRAWESTASGVKKLLLIALADMADEWGYCYPPIRLLARRCNVSERTVYRTISELADHGDIRLLQAGGGRGQANVYQVIIGLATTEIGESEQLSEIARKTLSDNFVTNGKNPDNLSSFSATPDKFVTNGKNPDNLSPLSNKNTDNLASISKNPDTSVTPTINAAVNNLESIKLTAALNDYPDNLSSFSKNPDKLSPIPSEILEALRAFGWRGSLADVEQAWREDPERVRQWVWYAGKQGWSGALLRTALRSRGEYPPEIDPNSKLHSRRYVEGAYADFIEH